MSVTKWIIDPTHSEIGFKVKHMMFTNVSGKFQNYNAAIETEGDDFENAKIEFIANVDSLTTGNPDRETHLLSSDFFDSAQFPKISFKSTSFKKTENAEYELIGDITIRGVSKSVKLNTEYSGLMKDPWSNIKAGFVINGKINRKDWGLNWNSALETGGVLVSEEVRLNIELQFVKQ
jgi:polyisoprenoid-binding protein YceI